MRLKEIASCLAMTKKIIMANEQNLIPFKKGDARINRNGRPKNFDALREMARELGYEPVDFREDPKARSVIEAILRDWMTSKNFQKQQAFMHYAFGKVPETFEVTQERNKIIVTWLGPGEEEEPNSNEFGTVSGGLWPQPDEQPEENDGNGTES